MSFGARSPAAFQHRVSAASVVAGGAIITSGDLQALVAAEQS